jgi:hypothetical protein
VISSLAGSSAFAALIWWVVPIGGLLGGLGYVVWVSKFKRKFESETSRSVGQFQRFQDSFRQELPAEEERPSEDSPSPNDGASSPEKL